LPESKAELEAAADETETEDESSPASLRSL
jgi:hypothetical protein